MSRPLHKCKALIRLSGDGSGKNVWWERRSHAFPPHYTPALLASHQETILRIPYSVSRNNVATISWAQVCLEGDFQNGKVFTTCILVLPHT